MDKKNSLSISQLLDAAASIPARAKNSASNCKPSIGIVNSNTNGRRLSFSKALVTALELEDVAEIALIPSEGCILIAKKIPIENVLKCKFSPKDTGKKICYSAGAVEAITEAFELNFSEHVSVSYDEVEFAIFDDSVPYAIVSVYNKYPNVNAG